MSVFLKKLSLSIKFSSLSLVGVSAMAICTSHPKCRQRRAGHVRHDYPPSVVPNLFHRIHGLALGSQAFLMPLNRPERPEIDAGESGVILPDNDGHGQKGGYLALARLPIRLLALDSLPFGVLGP
jgi:hypothetical protein